MLYRHYLLAGIPEEYMRYTEDDWFGDEDALAAMDDYLKNWKGYRNYGIGLCFLSKTQGTGKTFLATYLARQLILKNTAVVFRYFRQIAHLNEHLNEEGRLNEERRLREAGVLVLDDVIEGISDKQRDLFEGRFEGIIRERSDHNRPTIITTNLEPEELEKEYPRVYSLLAAKQKEIILAGGDVRKTDMLVVNIELAENKEIRPIS